MTEIPQAVGDVVMAVAGIGTPTDRVVVLCADPTAEIQTEFLRKIIDARVDHVEFGEGVMWFGTDGEGLGRVAYEIDDPRFRDWLLGRVETQTLTMRRVA